jgi:cation diffusion facilitator family transporter
MNSNHRVMKFVLLTGIILMMIKFVAWYVTKSNAILTDALESIINVVAGAFALYSLYYASKPKDEDHPYGHGKIEFFSAGIEGSLIFIAGLSMVIKAAYGFFHKTKLESLDLGILLSLVTAAANFIMGRILIRQGTKKHSATLVADGKHLISDVISTVGMIVGLLIIYLTGKFWIDNVLTVLLGAWIIFTGFRLVRESVGNLLDETDLQAVESIVGILNKHRQENWIDVHNLRLLKYGAHLHMDCHVTLPYYLTLEQSHDEVTKLETLVNEKAGKEVELFIHADPCVPESCPVCTIKNCPVRKKPFNKLMEWNLSSVLPDKKHR